MQQKLPQNTERFNPKPRLIIRNASLCSRFYTADGWTRNQVASYINSSTAMFYVIPRWYETFKDNEVKVKHFILADDKPYSDCDYFAVYAQSALQCLDIKRLKAENEIIPFSMPDETPNGF